MTYLCKYATVAAMTPDEAIDVVHEMYRNGQPLTHDEIVQLISWMRDNGSDVSEIVHAVEKPWKYAEELFESGVLLGRGVM